MSTDPTPEEPVLPDAEPPPAPSAPMPTLPPAAPIVPQPAETPAFDAKAMVEATAPKVDNPSYGGLPTATPEGLEASRRLRAQARRKRQRNRLLAWTVVAVFLGGVGFAGWFAYRAYQDDQDRQAAEREAARAADEGDEGGIAPGALTPLGNQQQVIDALDDINSSDAQLSGGGLRDIVDRAQAAVDGANGESNDPAPRGASVDAVLPASAVAVAVRLDDAEGYERFIVSVGEWSAANPAEYRAWLEAMAAEPQLGAGSPVFGVIPPVKRGEIAVALRREGDVLVRAIVVGLDPDLHVELG
jgi:hypothetical protein